MNLEILEESRGPIEIITNAKEANPHFHVPGTNIIKLKGSSITSVFQEFKGTNCSGWFNNYVASKPVVLCARGDIATLELRVSLSAPILGKWDNIEEPKLNARFYNIYYAPFVSTRAIFEPLSYESFDIHFELDLLKSCGIEHRLLDKFISRVTAGRPTTLFAHQTPCSTALLNLIFSLRHLNYPKCLQLQIFDLKMKEILLLALEPLLRIDIKQEYHVTAKEREMLYAAKEIIEQNIYEYPGNDVICKKTGLNEYKLKKGFKAVFGQKPYDYHLILKISRSKKMLLESNDMIRLIAYELGYKQSSSFGREFLKQTGMTPKDFRAKRD